MFNLAKIFDMAEQIPTNTNTNPITPVPEKKGVHPVKKFFRRVLLFFVFIIF